MNPSLSPTEQAELERTTRDAIAQAERNLQSVSGRTLNAARADIAEKVRSFLAQAREAVRDEDWPRARNLAEKARVLSTELVNSP